MAATSAISPLLPPKAQFVFINDTNPEDAKTKAKRKLVRAQAARGPHSNTVASQNRLDNARFASSMNKHQILKRKKDRANPTSFPLSLAGLDDLDPRPKKPAEQAPSKNEPVSIEVADNAREAPVNFQAQQAIVPGTSRNAASRPDGSPSSDSFSTSSLVPKMPGTGWVPPFVAHPDPDRPYIPMLIDHYLKNMAVDIPELDAGTPFILRLKWFPMVITSPATLYIVLLTAASHYAASNSLLPRNHIQSILLHLKQQTLTSINALIRATPKDEPMSDAIIGAVAKMASYEAMFGSGTLYHTHMRGLQNMIRARGGLEVLGLDGLLMRMVLWIDINSAFLLKSKAYFLPSHPLAGHTALQPNPGGFLAAS